MRKDAQKTCTFLIHECSTAKTILKHFYAVKELLLHTKTINDRCFSIQWNLITATQIKNMGIIRSNSRTSSINLNSRLC